MELYAGDILKSIGKYPVDHSNIELVLQQLVEPCVLPLSIVRKSGLILDVFDTQTMRRYTDEGILGFLEFLESCETSLNIFIDYLEKYSCACLLLSVDDVTELSPEYADIFYEFDLYKFFGGKKRETDATTIRGSVLTVGKSFMELFGEKEQCISINIKDVPHIIVQQAWKTHTFVMAMPSNWTSEHYLHSKLSHIKKLLKFMYGSAESALQFEKEECDWLFTVVFLSVAAVKFCNDCNFSVSKLPCCLLDDMEVTFLEESFPVTTPIPKLLKAQLDAVLCNLEACDVSRMVTSDFENDYVIIRGALIMYKNHLLCTHLPLSITQDIYNYLNLHRILSVVRHSQVFQIVVWSEVFLGEEPFQNKEPTADNLKWSLLVVVQVSFFLYFNW
ncbi:protein inturned-like [Artemia franciscana]|uniref:protein inturned-like n=1 Tax=Artemia franciscana TaxID=6661 RepID=UPI0032DAD86D